MPYPAPAVHRVARRLVALAPLLVALAAYAPAQGDAFDDLVATRPATTRPAATTNPAQAGTSTAPAGTQPASAGPRIAVVSRGRPASSALAPHELEELLARARALQPEGRAPWLIELDIIRIPAAQRDYRAIVYFAPEAAEGRFRRGKTAQLWSPGLEAQIALARQRLADEAPEPNDKPQQLFQTWCQVAPPDRPFAAEVDLLNPSLLPFVLPRGLTPQEIIEVVDFARTGPSTLADPSKEPWANLTFDGREAILDIRRDEKGVYEVRTTRPVKAGGAAGQILRCRVKNGRFEVVDILAWVP